MNTVSCKDGETGDSWQDVMLRSLYSSANIIMIKSRSLGRVM